MLFSHCGSQLSRNPDIPARRTSRRRSEPRAWGWFRSHPRRGKTEPMKRSFSVVRAIAPAVTVSLALSVVVAGCSLGSTSSDNATVPTSVQAAPTSPVAGQDGAPASTDVAFDSGVAGDTGDTRATTATSALPAGDPLVPIPALPVAKVSAPKWGTCTNKLAASIKLECANVTMPVDHAKPKGGTFSLMISRVKAKGTRRGSMLVNPGGPGASGITYASSVANRMPTEVRDAYDIIGFDPRGTGESMTVNCVDDTFLDQQLDVDPTPDNAEELAAVKASDLEGSCLKRFPDIDRFSTLRVVQDMDALRAALGDTKLTYYGVSYGSYLGAVYATAFPDKVGAMVLDGAFLPETTGNQSSIVQWGGFNKAFANWAAWCQEETDCAFNAPDVTQRYLNLVDQLDSEPLTSKGRMVGEGAITLATISSLYSNITWPIFGAALAQAEAGDGSGLLALADSYNQRDPSTGKYESLSEANTVISCASGIAQPIDGDLDAFITELKALGTLGRFVSDADWVTACNRPQPAVTYSGSAPLVVIGGKNDPATPYSQALALTAALGKQASLITFTGEGHGGLFESTCAKEAVRAYYLEGTRPAAGLSCEQAPPAAQTAALSAIALAAGFTEVPMDEGATLLGLDSSNFASRTYKFAGTGKAASKALIDALTEGGFTPLYSDDIPDIPDAVVGGLQNGADIFIFGSFGPKALQTSDMQSIAPLAGADSALVIIATPINAEALKSLVG